MKPFRIILLFALLSLVCQGCIRDDWPLSVPDTSGGDGTATRSTVSTATLTQLDNGQWIANRRVPLVGQGRIVDNVASAVVNVGAWNENIAALTDLDLTNAAEMNKGVTTVETFYNQLASVRDLNRVYAGGQNVGFVYKLTDSKLLEVKLLNQLVLTTFLHGVKQESKGGSGNGKVLDLNLLSIANNDGQQAISIATQVEKPFDEIRIGLGGVSADALSIGNGLQLYYAFVGDNPIEAATIDNTSFFPNGVEVHENKAFDLNWTGMLSPGNAIDSDLDNGAWFSVLSGALADPHLTINFKREIPAGCEVGFRITSGSVLDLGLFTGHQTLHTYGENPNKWNGYLETVTITNLLGLSAIGGGSNLISMVTKQACHQVRIGFTGLDIDLGATVVNYAYVREPVTLDASAYFTVANATVKTNGYQLPQNPIHPEATGTVSYVLLSQPAGANAQITADKRLSGMTVNGDYVVQATAHITIDGGEEQTLVHTFTVTRAADEQVDEGCDTKIVRNKYQAQAYIPEGGGSLLSIENIEHNDGQTLEQAIDAVVDGKPTTNLTYYKGISVAGNYAIIGVDAGTPINETKEEMRVGFTLQASASVLDVEALRFMRIVLKDAYGNDVYDGVADGDNSVSVGLIGTSSNKVRFSVKTTKPFQKVELWTSGVLNLNLSKMTICNAFFEPTSLHCENGSGVDACRELVTNATHNAVVDYDYMISSGLLSVGKTFKNMGNLVDSDPETYAEVAMPVEVGGSTAVSVKFDPIRAGQEIGFVMRDPTYTLTADLIKVQQLEVQYAGTTTSTTTEGGLLSANVIGYSGLIYITTIPPMRDTNNPDAKANQITRLTLVMGKGVGVFDFLKLSGLVLSPDSDGDGILDCTEENPDTEVVTDFDRVTATVENLCYGDALELKVEGDDVEALKKYAADKTPFYFRVNDLSSNNHDRPAGSKLLTAELRQNADDTYCFVLNESGADFRPGNYYLALCRDAAGTDVVYNGIHFKMYPTQATWDPQPGSTDWNDWDNWWTGEFLDAPTNSQKEHGSPWDCTDVVISSGCDRYPELNASEANYCHYIHFEPGAEVVGTHHLHYRKAWADLELPAGGYYLLAAPFKSMVTGDFFIPEALNGTHATADKFQALNETNCTVSRFTPRIYQRFWSSNVEGRVLDDGQVTSVPVRINETNWTAPFNAVNEYYTACGNGFSLQAEQDKCTWAGPYVFRFPKEHTAYDYYKSDGTLIGGQPESVNRLLPGRFIYENTRGEVSFPLTLWTGNVKGGTVFLVANPFMCHLDVQAFLNANPQFTGVKVTDGAQNLSTSLYDGELLSNGATTFSIAPMQAFFVTTATEAVRVPLNFTEQMLFQMPGHTVTGRRRGATRLTAKSARATRSAGRQPAYALRVTVATARGASASTLLRLTPAASDGYSPKEDIVTLFDDRVQPDLSVFSVADGQAMDIQQIAGISGTDIHLGLRLKQTEEVTLDISHEGGDWRQWVLTDQYTGRTYPLTDGYLRLPAGKMATNTGRFVLKRTNE